MCEICGSIEPMLYLCATPIGNLGDITLRAIETLKAVECVYCEDTRRTRELMSHLGVKKPLIACHEHNERQRGEEIAKRVLAGEAIAFVSDAGMPGISDPGEALVQACIRHGAPYTVLPGASAPLTALVMSGFSTKDACFAGFLPREGKQRREEIAALCAHRGTLIFYESPLRVAATAKELGKYFGNRKCALVRELTKKFEQAVRTDLEGLYEKYSLEPPKGECVLVVEGAREEAFDSNRAESMGMELIKKGISVKDASKQLSAVFGITKNEAYSIISAIKQSMDDEA